MPRLSHWQFQRYSRAKEDMGRSKKDRDVLFERHHPEIIGKPKSKLFRLLKFKKPVNRDCQNFLGKFPKILKPFIWCCAKTTLWRKNNKR
jgi:hypothetical protein